VAGDVAQGDKQVGKDEASDGGDMEAMRAGRVVPMGEEIEELRVGSYGKVEQVSG
jgi:hypothetical protein